jgi:chemotaxis protein methyltransferase CheR
MDQGDIELSEGEFRRVQKRLLEVAGISLGEAKRTLVISRLTKLVRKQGLNSFDAYLDFLGTPAAGKDVQQEFVNALTTNLTRFYREDHHFDHLRDYIGKVVAERGKGPASGKRLRIWSAGCSTGQEPFTIGMMLLQAYPELSSWDFKILATDIDTAVLAKAATGVYPESELSGLSAERAKVFERKGDGTVRVPQAVRNLISFKPLNLHEPWPIKGPFDAIFCRNVAIYFDKPVQTEMFNRMGDVLSPQGFLYIGHSESIAGGGGKFSLVGKTIYRPAGAQRENAA